MEAAFCLLQVLTGYLEAVYGLSSLRRRLYQSRLRFSCKLTSEGRTCGVPWLFLPCLAHGNSICALAAGQCSNKLVLEPYQPWVCKEQGS